MTIKSGDRVVIQNRGDGWDGVTGVAERVGRNDIWVRYDDPSAPPFDFDIVGGTWTVRSGYLRKFTKKVRIKELTKRVAELETTESALRNRIANLIDDRERARRSESIEGQRTAALIREKTDLELQVEDLLKGRKNDLAAMQELYLEINEAHAAIEYAFGLLRSKEDKSRLAGFRDGYATRVNED
jgi:hypothetical protein